MHDTYFAGKIIVLLKKETTRNPGPVQIAVNIALGPFTHVTEKSLRAAFEVLAEKENFQGVTLNIEKKKAVIKCRKCRAATEIAGPETACPACGSSDFEVGNTEEFIIESLEIT